MPDRPQPAACRPTSVGTILALVVFGLVLTRGLPAGAQDCRGGWLGYGGGVAVAPYLAIAEAPATEAQIVDCAPGRVALRWIARGSGGPAVAASALEEATPGGLRLSVTAGLAGTYEIGERVRAPRLQALDPKGTVYAPGRIGEAVRFYPYDWHAPPRRPARNSVVPVDLSLPGVATGAFYFVEMSDELAVVDIAGGRDAVEARLLLTRPANSAAGDTGEVRLPLAAGQSAVFEVLVARDLKAIQDRKWGSSAPMPPEKLTQVPYRGWAVEGYNLSADDYRRIARELARGGFGGVILRTMDPEKWVADLFKAQGLRVYLYQFWGAARELDSAGRLPRGVNPDWVLRGTAGSGEAYTAPSVRGPWRLLDLRRPEVRRHFADRARKAVADGWDGMFLDGPQLWADSALRFGGAGRPCDPARNTCMSFAFARGLALREIRQAIKEANPKAVLGLLASNQYIDQFHVADFLLKENVNCTWTHFGETALTGNVACKEGSFARWARNNRRYIENTLFLGAKSANPLIVTSAIWWADPAPRHVYLDVADFPAADTAEFAKLLGDIGAYFGSNRITRMAPEDAELDGDGPSVLRVPRPAAITLQHPAPVFDLARWRLIGVTDNFDLDPDGRYIVAERSGAGGLRYSREHFAWFANGVYLAGGIRFSQPPERDGRRFLISGRAIDDASVRIYGSASPPKVSANGSVLNVVGAAGFWQFSMPQGPTAVEIEF